MLIDHFRRWRFGSHLLRPPRWLRPFMTRRDLEMRWRSRPCSTVAPQSRRKTPLGETALVVACVASRPEAVALLIERGADVVARNNRGMTALHGASYSGCAECARQLLVAGASPSDAENRFKVTPLIVAAEENHPDILAMLLAAGADPEATERHGYTALTRAGFKARKETIAFLLARGGRCQPAKIAGGWSGECLKLAAEMARLP